MRKRIAAMRYCQATTANWILDVTVKQQPQMESYALNQATATNGILCVTIKQIKICVTVKVQTQMESYALQSNNNYKWYLMRYSQTTTPKRN